MKKVLIKLALSIALMVVFILINSIYEWELNLLLIGTVIAISYFFTAIKSSNKNDNAKR